MVSLTAGKCLDYYGSMPPTLRIWRLALTSAIVLGTLPAWSQAPLLPLEQFPPLELEPVVQPTADEMTAALNAELFYELLVGEMSAAQGDHTNAVALLLEAARTSHSQQLYQRAADLALQSRSGQRAMVVANQWLQNFPESRDANRYTLHTLLALNRVSETQPHLTREVALVPKPAKPATYLAIAQLYSRVSDKALAATVVEQALQADMADTELAPAAWATVGHLRVMAGQKDLARQALQHAYEQGPNNGATALLALELMEAGAQDVEYMVRHYVQHDPAAAIHMAYVRVLLGLQRDSDAQTQLNAILQTYPEMPDAWFSQATLQAQRAEWEAALQSLEHFFPLAQQIQFPAARDLALNQAYLLSARIAMQRKRYPQVIEWVDRIAQGETLLDAQALKALALARQGKLAHGRALIRAVPARTGEQEFLKRRAEVHLLRDADAPQEAYLLQRTLYEQAPEDTNLAYDTAILAERAGKLDAMETILRRIIKQDPGFYHAYNALGYSFADRGIHLPEARRLIETALSHVPGDPFITDSLAWVEFRLGNHTAALALLEKAYALRDDVEIGTHLGEVLWSMGEKNRARTIWRAAFERDSENETLRKTLERFQIKF